MERSIPCFCCKRLLKIQKNSLIVLGLLLCVSCSDETVTLSPMTEELTARFIDAHQDGLFKIKEGDLIILSYYQSDNKMVLYIWSDDYTSCGDEWPFPTDDYVGKTRVKDKEVLVFGPVKTMFYESNVSHPRKLKKLGCYEYDPASWNIVFRPDTTYSSIHTWKVTEINSDNSIDDISSIVLRYYPESSREEYYLNDEDFLLRGTFALGEAAFETILRRLIVKYQFTGLIGVVLRISRNGTVSIDRVGQELPLADQYIKAKKIAEEICKYKFEPATFRGVKVNSFYWFVIDNEIQE